MSRQITNILLVGVGGQGILLASEILSEAAMLAGARGHPVRAARLRSPEAEWRVSSGGRLLACSLSTPEGLGSSILVARDVTDAVQSGCVRRPDLRQVR